MQHAYRQQANGHIKGNVAFVDCGSLFFGNNAHFSIGNPAIESFNKERSI